MESRVSFEQFRIPSIELRTRTLAAGSQPAESGEASSEFRNPRPEIHHVRKLS